jgi:hypothetical protein
MRLAWNDLRDSLLTPLPQLLLLVLVGIPFLRRRAAIGKQRSRRNLQHDLDRVRVEELLIDEIEDERRDEGREKGEREGEVVD